MNAVEIKNLSKNFGPKQAVCGLDMTVPMGAIYGFIGERHLLWALRKLTTLLSSDVSRGIAELWPFSNSSFFC